MRRRADKPLMWLHGEVRTPPLTAAAADATWRIVYRIDADAIVVADVFAKKTQVTSKSAMDACKRRLRDYDATVGDKE